MLDILKNPLILGLLVAAGIYMYMYWEMEKKYKKNPKIKRKPVSILTPGIIGIIVWFIASSYMGEELPQTKTIPIYQSKHVMHGPLNEGSCGSLSYHLIKDNDIKLPSTDVFIDLAPF